VTRLSAVVATFAILGLGAVAYGRAHAAHEPLDPSKGASLSSRIPCDGSTNPQDEMSLAAAFSPGGWERSFSIDQFEEKYCQTGDLEFVCLKPGHSTWRQKWSTGSSGPAGVKKVGLDSCYKHGLKDPPKYLLTGWYKEGASDSKLARKQAAVKQVSSNPEVYEFADPNGGTARLEVNRR
jgi:hypothetical protein